MSEPISKPENVLIPRTELEGLVEALNHYMRAFSATGNAYGQDDARKFARSLGNPAFLWQDMWYGRNHQKIKVGDRVRRSMPGDEPPWGEAEVLDVTTFTACVQHENGWDWEPWPLIHRIDRLHTEPDFDITHWVPIQRHMGYAVDPADAAAYEEHLAKHPQVHQVKKVHLAVVREDGDAS